MRINLYGLLIASAILLASFILQREGKKRSLYSDIGLDMILYAVPLGVLGARIYYVLFSVEQYLHQPWKILAVWKGGLAIYGGIIGGFIGLLLLAKKKTISILVLTDMALPPVLLGQSIGRWGNFFNQEAYGAIIANTSFQFFPLGVFIDGQWYYATFFYESIWNLLAAMALFYLQKKTRKSAGFVTIFYFLFYGLGRSIIEPLRTDSLMLGPLRISQLISLVFIIISTYYLFKKFKETRGVLIVVSISFICLLIGALFQKYLMTLAGFISYIPILFIYFKKARKHEAEII
jgi:phosphatidylglycerol:prolipoprotein diacylglycerol transferase